MKVRREAVRNGAAERGRKQTSDLDFPNVCWQKNIRAFTMLFYFRLMDGYRWPVGVSRAMNLMLFFVCFFRENKDVCVREKRVQLSREPASYPRYIIHRDLRSTPWLRSHNLEVLIYLSLTLLGFRQTRHHS